MKKGREYGRKERETDARKDGMKERGEGGKEGVEGGRENGLKYAKERKGEQYNKYIEEMKERRREGTVYGRKEEGDDKKNAQYTKEERK